MKLLPALLTLILAALLAGNLHAQSSGVQPVAVSLCDLLNHAADYDGKVIQTTGEIHLAFEEFQIVDARCSDAFPSMWLYYGDEAQSTMYAPFNNPKFSADIHFINDDQMKTFRDLIQKRRERRPDGTLCYERECNFYNVTATITGHFLAVKKYFNKGAIPNGYGHMGCCHALIIERISNLQAQRTEVPEGEIYPCTQTRWKLNKEEAKQLFPNPHCGTYLDCQRIEQSNFQLIAQHWHDQVTIENGSIGISELGGSDWYSSDLLLNYQITGKDQDSRPTRVVREICQLRN